MNRKISLSGPSGLGKTTLCRFIEKEFNVPWHSVSAGDLFTEKDKMYLQTDFGYTGKGHRNVINLSSSDPLFGNAFQNLVLKRRAELIENTPEFVIDRSPLDNVVYYLSQNGHNEKEEFIGDFIEKARKAYEKLTHVIIIKYSSDITQIEDNDSRIPNRYYQRMISDLFQAMYVREFASIIGPKVITIDFWDLDQRKSVIKSFING
jgi:hypothetical protein